MAGNLIVISGPSGVGKSTVARRLAEKIDARISISATTRQKGPREKNGEDYWFLTEQEFRELIDQDKLLEYAKYMGNYYGTLREPVEKQIKAGGNMILEIEIQGAKEVAKKISDGIMIFLLPPDNNELVSRITGRARDDDEVIQRRLANTKREIDQAHEAGIYQYWIVNDRIERVVDEIAGIISQKQES